MLTGISIKKTNHSGLNEVDFKKLEFGKYIADHMLVCDYYDGAWHQAQIVPYANLSMSPATLALHYGQTVFEGMKAFRMIDGKINIFRIERHHQRFNRSLHRMCMPEVPEEIFVDGLSQLIDLDRNWVPVYTDGSLYIRPFMYASESKLGVKVSDEYRLIIISSPVQSVFSKPLRVKVETEYIRAARGGTGFAKCGGNYGGAFYPTRRANQQGYDQLLWTGGKDNRFIEESGMMNALFVINDKLVTAPLSDSILDGITRDSLLLLAKEIGVEIEERPVSVDELINSLEKNTITEAFGAGTAAVVAPIETIGIDGKDYTLPPYSKKSILNKLKDKLELIRTGQEQDIKGWNYLI